MEKQTPEPPKMLSEEALHFFDDIKEMFRKSARQTEEIKRLFKNTDKKFQETDRQFKATDRKLNTLENLFNSQWGRLIESLVDGAIVKIFNQWGISVEHTTTRAKGVYQDHSWELDIIAKNGDAVIVTEVKTTLRPDDVKNHLQKLPMVKKWMREYENNTIYGAVAYLTDSAGAAQMAENKGLFVIKATGDSAFITNSRAFQARTY